MTDANDPMTSDQAAAQPTLDAIAALNDLYRACNTAAEQVRRQIMRFKVRYRYCRLVHELKHLLCCECCRKMHESEEHEHGYGPHKEQDGDCLFCWAICALHRIERIGGDADSTLDTVGAVDDVRVALEIVAANLRKIADHCNECQTTGDPLTAQVAGKIACSVDHHLECIQAHLRQIDDMGPAYLTTIV